MPLELSGWKELCPECMPLAHTAYTLGYGQPLSGLEVSTLLTGSGMANASVAMGTALALLRPERAYGVGIAGAIDQSLQIGQMVLFKEVIQYELAIGRFSLERGQLNGPLPIWLESTLSKRLPRELCPVRGGCADLFFDQAALKSRRFMTEELGIRAVDMESYGYLAAGWMQKTEVSVIKSISDRLGQELPKRFSPFVRSVSIAQRELILGIEKEMLERTQ